MATKNKKDTVTDLNSNIFTNTTKQVTASKVKIPMTDLINSVSFNMTIAQLQAEDNSGEPTTVEIIDATGKQGVFYYDSVDVVTTDDGGSACIVTASGRRYKRRIDKAINALWYGKTHYYFDNLAEAITKVKAFTRFVGLEVTLLDANGALKNYWFNGGIADANLVLKTTDVYPLEFIVGDGGANTPADGAIDYVNAALAGATLTAAYAQGRRTPFVISPTVLAIADTYFQFAPNASPTPKIIIKNGTYNTDAYYAFTIKK